MAKLSRSTNVLIMLETVSTATSAQAVAARQFYDEVEMKEVTVVVKVQSVSIANAQQLTQWFDATDKLFLLYPAVPACASCPESEEPAQKKPKPSEVEMKK